MLSETLYSYRYRRISLGMSQSQLAAKIGIHKQTYSKFERLGHFSQGLLIKIDASLIRLEAEACAKLDPTS